ncbi:UBN2_2 domain-containing protein [Cephalotus follicularis]|uniref:UBN2_2 domain-containing protein n=1 Tax=Cephalotus follicularis TaxID=3775 RepID=A0A1Q3BS76_CEPFO|nr:UBN2_2 domain-containing protein [Cephalotus follicularis]
MVPELQRQHEKLDTLGAILLRLQELYGSRSRTESFNLSRQLFCTKMAEGSSVHTHGLKMIDLVEQLAQLHLTMHNDFYIDLVLSSLPRSYSQFIINFHMNKVDTNLPELLEMLRTAEHDMGHGRSKSDVMYLPSTSSWMAPRGSGSRVSKSKMKAPMKPKGKKKRGKRPTVPAGTVVGGSVLDMIRQLQDDDCCFYYGKYGHWGSQRSEFKNSKSGGTSGSGTFMIELFLATNVSSTWVLDSGCGTNICNSLQGLRGARQLREAEALDLRLGDGSRITLKITLLETLFMFLICIRWALSSLFLHMAVDLCKMMFFYVMDTFTMGSML